MMRYTHSVRVTFIVILDLTLSAEVQNTTYRRYAESVGARTTVIRMTTRSGTMRDTGIGTCAECAGMRVVTVVIIAQHEGSPISGLRNGALSALDPSCGDGRFLKRIAHSGVSVIGIALFNPGESDSLDLASSQLPEDMNAENYCRRLYTSFTMRNPFYD